MKIVVLSSHTPSLFWFRLDMMKEFIKLGHSVTAVGHDDDDKWRDKLSKHGINYRCVPVDRNGTDPFADIRTFLSIYRLLKEEKPDKIFAYQAKPVIYGCIAARVLGIKEVYPLIAGVGSILLSQKLTLIKLIVKTQYKIALKGAKKIFFQNTSDVEEYVFQGITSKDKIVMINGSGVNLEHFTPSPLPEDPVFLFIGRLIRDKGVREYLEAARLVKQEYPQAKFLVVGPFDSNPTAITPKELSPYIEDKTVEYFGEQTDVKPFLQSCSVFVLPSYREGTPKSVLEALACGRAVITTDAPGCKETVTDGYNGLLIPTKDTLSLCEAMKKLICSPQLVKALSANARSSVSAKYDVKDVNRIILTAMELIP